MGTPQRYQFADGAAPDYVIGRFTEKFDAETRAVPPRLESYYDTFDWRLHRNGLYLTRDGDAFHLRQLDGDRVLEQAEYRARSRTAFWWDFPRGGLREALKRQIGVRALIHLVTVKVEGVHLALLNRDRKTVGRVVCEEIRWADETNRGSGSTLLIQPVKGYRKVRKEMEQVVDEAGLRAEVGPLPPPAIRLTGLQPGSYSSKIRIELKPGTPARQAVCRILAHLSHTMQLNAGGIKADIDTEFLHDFRVAVRRTRSALSQLDDLFPTGELRPFKDDFKHLGKVTNRMRDLDVNLLREREYSDLLPPDLRPGIAPLFRSLSRKRKVEQRRLAEALDGEQYREIASRWDQYLAGAARGEGGESAERPVEEVARRVIGRRYRQVVGLGRSIDGESPDERLHRLRIHGKKLRYLLEFFASLFPRHEMNDLIGQLKKLQDNLGDFNDLRVQRENLATYLDEIQPEQSDAKVRIAAVGGLLVRLHERQAETRHAFDETFARFAKRSTARLFERLFSTGADAGEADVAEKAEKDGGNGEARGRS